MTPEDKRKKQYDQLTERKKQKTRISALNKWFSFSIIDPSYLTTKVNHEYMLIIKNSTLLNSLEPTVR